MDKELMKDLFELRKKGMEVFDKYEDQIVGFLRKEKVTAEVAIENTASNALLRKFGFKIEKESQFQKYRMPICFDSYIYAKYLGNGDFKALITCNSHIHPDDTFHTDTLYVHPRLDLTSNPLPLSIDESQWWDIPPEWEENDER